MASYENVHAMVQDFKYCTNKKLLLKSFETLEIDNIVDSKLSKDEKRHYLVCFKSWLPEEQLNNYNELIEDYWRKREESKNWQGSHDGESDKENNFISPSSSSSKSKRAFVFPPSQPSPNQPEAEKIKFIDNHNNNGLNLPLDLPDENVIKPEPEANDETFELSIDESNELSTPTAIYNEPKSVDGLVDRLITNSNSCGSSPRSLPDERTYTQPISISNNPTPIYNGRIDDTLEHTSPMHFLGKASISTNGETEHRPNSLDGIAVIGGECQEELPDYHDNLNGKVNGERHLNEFHADDDCENGQLSLYDDEPMNGERNFSGFGIEEDGDSDVSEFGVRIVDDTVDEESYFPEMNGDDRHSSEMFRETQDKDMNGDRTSSGSSDVTPEENIQLNKFTPLNSVQVKKHDSHFSAGDSHFSAGDSHFATNDSHFSTSDSHFSTGDPHFVADGPLFATDDPHFAAADPHFAEGDADFAEGDAHFASGDLPMPSDELPEDEEMYPLNFQEQDSPKQTIDNEGDSPRSTPTSQLGEPTNHISDNGADAAVNTNSEESKTVVNQEKPGKKRKGKTLDDIVRKISSANEQAAEKSGTQVGEKSGAQVGEATQDDQLAEQDIKTEITSPTSEEETKFIKEEVMEKSENGPVDTEMPHADEDKSISTTHDGKRENNVYWSAGKAFHKRNISYKCKFCEHRFDDETLLKDHERSHGHHHCRNCNEVFLTSADLFEHRESAHAFKPRQRYNKCRFCPTLYADPAMLQRHEEIHHLSRSPIVTHAHAPHGEEGINDLPPPLVSIETENQRKFPRYENHREHGRSEVMYRPRSPRELVRKSGDGDAMYDGKADDEEGKSIVRNPIRNLLGKMYQTQKKLEHSGGERFSRFYTSKLPPPPGHQYHYADYPHRHPHPAKVSPEHPQREREMREHRSEQRSEHRTEHRTAEAPPEEEGTCGARVVHVCRLCNKSFGLKETLEQHWLTVHQDTPSYSCEVCHEVFIDKDELSAHMSVHLKQDFYCGYCRKAFDCRANYESHMRAHNNDRPFRCHICGRAFSLRTNLRRHVLIHTDITPYRCHVCFKGFRRSDMLSSHIKQYHSGSNEEKYRKYDSSEPVYNGERRHDDQTVSDSVSPVFQPPSGSSSPYTSHENNNGSNDNGHNDNYSNTSPRHHSDAPHHHNDAPHHHTDAPHHHNDGTNGYPIEPRMKHSPDSMNQPTSPRVRNSPNVVARHESGDTNAMNSSPNSHPQQMNHLPNVPGMHQLPGEHAFHRPNGILAPIGSERPSHQLVAPIPVMKQSRFSPYKTNLINILPQPLPASRMECTECGEKFTSESLYEIHMQSHVKEATYACRKCRRTFSGKSQYNSHMQTHENTKSHSCPYCHRSFSMKGNLRRHIRIHTNEAPYECPICFQRFRRSDGLKGHIKRHDAMGESAPGDMVPSQAST